MWEVEIQELDLALTLYWIESLVTERIEEVSRPFKIFKSFRKPKQNAIRKKKKKCARLLITDNDLDFGN